MGDIIPSMVDGLKDLERLVLSLALENYSINEDVEIYLLAAGTGRSNHVCPIEFRKDAIVSLAHNFVGTNNINLFESLADIGNRYKGPSKIDIDAPVLEVRLTRITGLLLVEDDDLVALHKLEGCDACGKSPNWLLPIIPLVLVNGCDGGGLWLKSYIPKYHPGDVIANVKNYMNKKELVPMVPWFKGFKGKVVQSSTDETEYIISGILEKINDQRRNVVITELPVGVWTHDYISWLEGQPWIQCYEDLSVCKASIQLEVTLLGDAWLPDEEYLMKKLELTKTISLRDMHLIHPNGEVVKYDNPLHIIDDFVSYRYSFYLNRRDLMLVNANSELTSIKSALMVSTGAACRNTAIVKHWMSKFKPRTGAADLSKLQTLLDNKLDVSDVGDFSVREALIAVRTLFDRLVSLKESNKGHGSKHLSSDDMVVLETVCNALRKLMGALSEVEELTIRRVNLTSRINQLQKENGYCLWSKDLDYLELFFKGQEKVEEVQCKTRKATSQRSKRKVEEVQSKTRKAPSQRSKGKVVEVQSKTRKATPQRSKGKKRKAGSS